MLFIEIIGMFVCFYCMAVIAAEAENSTTETPDSNLPTIDESPSIFGYVLIVATTWVYASNAILNRALKDFHYVTIMTYHGLTGLSIALLVILVSPLFTHGVGSYWEGITFFSYTWT